jgi:hypothetical protein
MGQKARAGANCPNLCIGATFFKTVRHGDLVRIDFPGPCFHINRNDLAVTMRLNLSANIAIVDFGAAPRHIFLTILAL